MLRPLSIPLVPKETARVAQAAFLKSNRYLKLRGELGTIFDDEMFAHLFPKVGQPGEAPWRLALVTIVQHAEGLSDREAADAVRARIDLKYLLGLELEDPGFHYSILSRFRDRLIKGETEHLLLDTLIEKCREAGLIKARGKCRTDATHILAATRVMTRLEFVSETLRAALNRVAIVEPEWLKAFAPADWYGRYGKRAEQGRLLRRFKDKQTLTDLVGTDGMAFLSAVFNGNAPDVLQTLPEVDVLRRCWLEQFYVDDGQAKLRDAKNLKSSPQRLDTPYDTDAHYGTKGGAGWLGYKVHYTESCNEDAPHLVVHVDTTEAAVADSVRVTPVHETLKKKNLLPSEHFVDNHYVTSKLLVTSEKDYGVSLVGPIKPYREPEGLSIDLFEIDWQRKRVTCPAGKQSTRWIPKMPKSGREQIAVSFAPTDCKACPLNEQCAKNTKRIGRTLALLPQEQYEARERVKREQRTWEWRSHYNIRSGVEGTFSQGVSAGLRRSRYHGLKKNHLQNVSIAAGINVQRLTDWFEEIPQAKTRTSRFAALNA